MAVRIVPVLSALSALVVLVLLAVSALVDSGAARGGGSRDGGVTVHADAAANAGTAGPDRISTNATYYNDASVPGADPHVLFDEDSGYYYAYSTTGADPGYQFGIYRSPDLITWEHLPGGALDTSDGTQWGHDWFWAPEVYHNPETGLYYLFYSARMNDNVARHFGHADFEEPCKIGVAVADSPQGPFRNITDEPLDYYPYDPDYHDVNLIMGPEQKEPPETLAEGRTAPLGTYIPMIDPNVFFDNGRIYLYFSRNAYRNWVWDHDLDKYIEESNIYAVELTTDWWHDPTGETMPRIRPRYRNANRQPGDPAGVRRDGFTPILSYHADEQAWENAHVDDYVESAGRKKDRRWEEGSTTIKRYRYENGRRVPVYYLLYSANHYRSRSYGVGYAVSDSPLGPWRKSDDNPILETSRSTGLYSAGHGSVVASPDGTELFYVHHGRPSTTTYRRLYTSRLRFVTDEPGVGGAASLVIEESLDDEPIPSGVAPYSLTTDARLVDVGGPEPGELSWTVTSAEGAAMELSHPLNRVDVRVTPADGVVVRAYDDHVRISGDGVGVAALTLSYQRRTSDGEYVDIDNVLAAGSRDRHRQPVEATVPVAGCTSVITGEHAGPLRVSDGVTCLRDATVSGPVHVAPGASLVAVRSALAGGVRARRPGAVWISGGTVAGLVRVDGAAGIVRLAGTTVSGHVVITDSAAGPSVVRSVVHGSVSVDGSQRSDVVLDDNVIAGELRCTGTSGAGGCGDA